MSTKTIESSETRSMQVEMPVLTPTDRSTLPRSTEFSSAVYRNFAAMYTTWTGFINRRLKEDLTLPEHLGECKSGRYRRRRPLVPTDDVHLFRRMTSSAA